MIKLFGWKGLLNPSVASRKVAIFRNNFNHAKESHVMVFATNEPTDFNELLNHHPKLISGILDRNFGQNSFYLLLVELQIFRFANFDVRTFCQLKDCDDDDENCGRRWRLLSEHSIIFISWIHFATLFWRLFSCLSELLTNFITTLTWFSFYFRSRLFLLKSFHQTSRFTVALLISDVNTSIPLARLKRLLMETLHSALSAQNKVLMEIFFTSRERQAENTPSQFIALLHAAMARKLRWTQFRW